MFFNIIFLLCVFVSRRVEEICIDIVSTTRFDALKHFFDLLSTVFI